MTRRLQIASAIVALTLVFGQRVVVQFEFGTPRNLGSAMNQPGFDGGPSASNDGLTLYFVSDRPGGAGGSDLWFVQRTTSADRWSIPVNLGPTVNGKDMDASPSISSDGLELYFDSNRSGGQGEWDVWVTTRASLSSPWELPKNLGPLVNSEAGDGTPQLTRDGRTLYFASWRARRIREE